MGRKLGLDRVLDCFSLAVCANACVCVHAVEDDDEENEGKALVSAQLEELLKLKDFGGGAKTLAFHLEPKTVELRVSMHCYGCARKVQKHISKMEGLHKEGEYRQLEFWTQEKHVRDTYSAQLQ